MSFFKRVLGKPTPQTEVAAYVPQAQALTVAPLVGTEPCSERDCGSTAALPCAYRDRRGRVCLKPFCADHHLNIDGKAYCRRHAGVVRALQQSSDAEQGPDLDNRAPSLTEWVANDIDADVRTILDTARDGRADMVLAHDALSVMLQGTPRVRCWQRMWKLSDSTGILIKVALFVEETNDNEVAVRVDSEILGRVIPPWITERKAPPTGAAEDDARRRLEFKNGLVDAIRDAVETRRALIARGL